MSGITQSHTYSIHYCIGDESDPHALDWGWVQHHGSLKHWTASRRCSSIQWEVIQWEVFEEDLLMMHEVLLKHFGLTDWEDEFPPEKIVLLSPRQLAFARRAKEDEFDLEHHRIKSDTVGYHVHAEDHPD